MTEANVGEREWPAKKPALLEAVDVTLRTMERRTRMYRNLVVLVSLTGLGSLVLVFVFHRWIALTGLLALPVYVGVFLFLDAQIVRTWRDQIWKLRDQRGLNVEQLEKTLTAFRYVPPATLRSMLAMVSELD